jgi:hypothetical protein
VWQGVVALALVLIGVVLGGAVPVGVVLVGQRVLCQRRVHGPGPVSVCLPTVPAQIGVAVETVYSLVHPKWTKIGYAPNHEKFEYE